MVRLDSLPTYRGTPPDFYGFGMRGFWTGSDSSWLTWSAPSADSLVLATVGLGGYLWRFQKSGDTLVGLTYETYDIVDEVTRLGSASAHRHTCP
jgi:hypothetical protein